MTAKPRTTTAIRFTPAIHERLRKASEDHDLPMNYLVNRAVFEFLENLLPAGEIRFTRDEPS